MARSSVPFIPEEDVSTRADFSPSHDQEEVDIRPLDIEADEDQAFLRGTKRVPVRRTTLRGRENRKVKSLLIVAIIAVVCLIAGIAAYHYGERSWRFRIDSSDEIDIAGTKNVTRRQVMEVLGADIGRNVFFIPLSERQKKLEEIPWVESAAVMRFMPNRLRVMITERTPIAFVQVGSKVELIDRFGVVMDLPAASLKKYSFPVIVGMSPNEPLSTRAARMKIYSSMVEELDADGSKASQDLSEADLSDPEDAKVMVQDPGGQLLVHLGSSNFASRFKIYKAHIQEWRQQFQKLESVDLRYDRQIIVNPDSEVASAPPPSPRVVPISSLKRPAIKKPIVKPVVKKVVPKATVRSWKKQKTKEIQRAKK